jgi:signal transduction histidine kinase
MTRGAWIAVALALTVALGVAAATFRAARRDRSALISAFSEEHLSRLRFAAREVESELEDVSRDLEFATKLVATAATASDRARELRALLAVVRAYRMVVVFDGAGRQQLAVVDPLAPTPWSAEPFEQAFQETARRASNDRALAVSRLVPGPHSPWYRVFATPSSSERSDGAAVAILVDLRDAFERLRVLAPDASTGLLVLGPDGQPSPMTDAALAARVTERGRSAGLESLVAALRSGASGTMGVAAADSVALGLAESDAVAAYAPIRDVGKRHWAVAVLVSTNILRSRERAITLQLAGVGATLALALSILSGYLVLNARRVIAVQERLRAAEQVAHHREKAEKILENVPVAVIALNHRLEVSGLNRAAHDAVPLFALGRPLDDAFPQAAPGALEPLRAAVREARTTGKVQSVVAQPLALSGVDTYFAVHVVPLEHPLPDVSVLLVLADLTELRALSSQLVRAEKLATVGVLAAGIAHEIGTPLGIVRGRAERIGSKLGPEHPLTPGAQTIVEEIDRISRIIRELLDYSRLAKASTISVSLDGVAANVMELLAVEARSREVSLFLDLAPRVPPVAADPDQLQQVLVNLVMNGLHACSFGGRVTLRAGMVDGERVAIEVEDDGAGIPDDLRNRVFDPFFTTKKRGKGTGLGLTVAAQLVRNHGGDIQLESTVGRGTLVRVLWPLARAAEVSS